MTHDDPENKSFEDGTITFHVDGWALARSPGSEEPRIRDIELAEQLGFKQPRDIRKLIQRLMEVEQLPGINSRATVARQSTGNGGEREYIVNEYWLNEEEALFVATQSKTPKAFAITKALIRVFTLARKGLLPGQNAAALATVNEDIQGLRRAQVETALILQDIAARTKATEAQLAVLQNANLQLAEAVQTVHENVQATKRIAFDATQSVIGQKVAVSEVCRVLNEITAIRMLFDPRSKRSIRKSSENRLRNWIGLGQGVPLAQIPKDRMPQVQQILKDMRADADYQADPKKQAARVKPAQQELFPNHLRSVK